MIQQIVFRRDLRKHLANFLRCFRFRPRSQRPCSLHRSGSLNHVISAIRGNSASIQKCRHQFAKHSPALRSEYRFAPVCASPMRGDSTNRNFPDCVFCRTASRRSVFSARPAANLAICPLCKSRMTVARHHLAAVTPISRPSSAATIIPQATASPCR